MQIPLQTYICTWGHTDVWVHSDMQGFIQTYGAYECMRGVQTPPKCPHASIFIHPIHLDAPHMFRVLIGYLFCYIIKCFPTLEAGMGVVRLMGYPYAPYVHMPHVCLDAPYILTPQYVWTLSLYVWMPPMCLDAPYILTPQYVWTLSPYVWMPPGCLNAPYTSVCCHAPMYICMFLGVSAYDMGTGGIYTPHGLSSWMVIC